MLLFYFISCILSIDQKFIIVLKSGLNNFGADDHISKIQSFIDENNVQLYSTDEPQEKSKIEYVYNPDIINGYSGKFNNLVINYIKKQPEVDYVEEDGIVKINYHKRFNKKVLQKDAPWGLSRITTKDYKFQTDFQYDPEGGKGVNVYVIDTGININHSEFEGRAVWGTTIPSGEDDNDHNGHGTHVAGTVGGKTYGIARKCKIIAVKALKSDGYGTTSDIIKAVEWVIEDSKKYKASIINMSIGGGFNRALNYVIEVAYKNGIFSVIAAGNENQDACKTSPSSSPYSFTVAATDSEDNKASFSNFGKCVNIWAPGNLIKSAWYISNTSTKVISGTSMAAPHVAGVAAVIASKIGGRPDLLKEYLLTNSLKGVIKNIQYGNSPNSLLFLN